MAETKPITELQRNMLVRFSEFTQPAYPYQAGRGFNTKTANALIRRGLLQVERKTVFEAVFSINSHELTKYSITAAGRKLAKENSNV